MASHLLSLTPDSIKTLTLEFQEYYKRNHITIDTSGCHIWQGSLSSTGRRHTSRYGQCWVTPVEHNQKPFKTSAHIVAFFLENRTIPEKGVTDISHICHNSLCVNIEHLVKEIHWINIDRNRCKETNYCFGHTKGEQQFKSCIFK